EINHQIWVGLRTGHIYIIENNQSKKFTPQEGLPKKAINDIIADKQHNIWIATSGEGIYCYRDKKLFNWNTDDGLTDNYVYDLELDNDGNIVAGTDQGLSFCYWEGNKKRVSKFTSANGLPDNITRVVKSCGNNIFLIGTQDKGLFWLNKNNPVENKSVGIDIMAEQINCIGYHNNIFLTATENGLYNGTITTSKGIPVAALNKNAVASGKYAKTLIDKEGNEWVCYDNKLSLVNSTSAQKIIPDDKVDTKKIHSLLYTQSATGINYLWATGDKRIQRFIINNNSATIDKSFPIKGIDEKTEITSLYEDAYRNIWIGTMGKGIFVLNPADGSYRNINEDSLLSNGSILSITGSGNDIWISSLAGAIKCTLTDANAFIRSSYHFTNYNEVSGIGTNYIYTIFVDSKKRVWFGTDGKGITVFENNVFKNYNKQNGLEDEVIYSIAEDSKGYIWFSTSAVGLYKFDGKQFTNYAIQQGLSYLSIASIEADNHGNILVTNEKGVDIINAETGNIYYISNENVLDKPNATLNCITKDGNGNIYFSSNKGIFSYNPWQNKDHAQVVTILDDVQLFLQSIDFHNRNTFSYDQNNFTFNFAGLYYSDPDKVEFQYKLDDFNNEWFTTKDHFASFPKLPAGTYTFHIRASLNNNFSAAKEVTYTFTINKPYWRQWWFLLLAAIVLALIFYSIIKYREREVQKLQQLQQEKIQFQFETLKNQVNPHFLFNSFNTLISVIDENPHNAIEYVEQLSDFYRTIVTTRENELIPLEEELSLINKYFFIQQKRFGSSLNYVLSLSEEDIKHIQIPPLTLQLLAENAIKHNAISKETPLTFEILRSNDYLVVQNNINEKINKEPSTGIGLPNIIHRYRLLSGKEVRVENNHQTFKVLLPVL
ncbi:MAG: histidine kinase, partial [Sphingobacteriales bacterium]|nr:histidine kinase [Sphingobacteriales bacterium]